MIAEPIEDPRADLSQWLGRVHCGDAVELLRLLPDASVDLCVADPPYGISGSNKVRVRTAAGARKTGRGKSFADASAGEFGEEDREAGDGWFAELPRILRPGASLQVFCAQRQWQRFRDIGEACKLRIRSPWYWCKNTPPPTPRDNFSSAVENGWWFYNPGGPVSWYGGHNQRNWWAGDAYHGTYASGGRIHPMQKPEWLLDEFMRLWTRPGDVVLDLFAGSATTSVCALRAGCDFIAIEKDPTHCENSAKRIAEACRKLSPTLALSE